MATDASFDFDELLRRYVELLDEERDVRAQRLGLARLSDVKNRQYAFVSAAASRLPAKGAGASRIVRALAAEDDTEAVLALEMLFSLRPFPKRFVRPVVRRLILDRRERWLRDVSHMYGWRPVFDEIYAMAEEGYLSEKLFDLVRSYVGSSAKDGPRESCKAERASRVAQIVAAIRKRAAGAGVLPWIDRKSSKRTDTLS